MTNTPRRSVRVPDELWQAAQRRSAELGEDVSAVIVRSLSEYVTGRRPRPKREVGA